jgi:hypothetical protein
MLINEAILLCTLLDRIAPKSILDIGSSSRAGREIVQPQIGAAFRGFNVTWTDTDGSGDTIACDITQLDTLRDLPRCELVTALSVLEHVTDIPVAIRNLRGLVKDWLIVSVPYQYPEHKCPIDNLWRPDAGELASRISYDGLRVVAQYNTEPEQFGAVSGACASLVVARRSDHG